MDGDAAGDSQGGAGDVGSLLPALSSDVVTRFGLVSIHVNGQYVCAGTLLTNSWILTADQCAPKGASSLTIGFGASRVHPSQTQRVAEIVRFPGNDGSAELRGRDLVLLGVEAPFEVSKKLDQVFEHLPPWPSRAGLAPMLCAGWDLGRSPGEDDPPAVAELSGFHVEEGLVQGGRSLGDRFWYQLLPGGTLLPSQKDVGVVCFLNSHAGELAVSVHVGNPTLRYGGLPNDDDESYATSLVEDEVRGWLDATLIGVVDDDAGPDVSGGVNGCSMGDAGLEIFSVNAGGEAEQRSGDETWSAPVTLGRPAGQTLQREALGTLCWERTTRSLFARAADNSVWWLERDGDGVWADWVQVVNSAATPVSVLPLAVDRFDLFMDFANGELHRVPYRKGWWEPENLEGGLMAGGFAAVAWNEDRVDVFGVGADQGLWQQFRYNGSWEGWTSLAIPSFRSAIDVEVGAALMGGVHLDLFARSLSGNLLHSFYNVSWTTDWLDTGVAVPSSHFKIVASAGARRDFLGVGGDGRLWHAVWPRLPRGAH